jgi:drug/metabolite transporter (DMT)-like permease
MKKQVKGILMLLLATLIWGSTFIPQRMAMSGMPPFYFQAIRCTLAVLALIPVTMLLDRSKKDRKNYFQRWHDKKLWIGGVLCGLTLFFACNLQQIGLVDTDAGKSAFLTAMYIVIVPIIGIFLKKKPSKMIPLCVLLAVAGLYFLSCVGVTRISTGDLLLIGCALMFAVQITFVDIFAPQVDPVRLNLLQVAVCAVLSTIVAVTTETTTFEAVLGNWFPLCYAGILSMGVAYTMQIFGQLELEPASASLIMSLESVFAVVFGAIILHERMTGWEILGCVLLFIAVILSQIKLPAQSKE